jgi:hypothetical protein
MYPTAKHKVLDTQLRLARPLSGDIAELATRRAQCLLEARLQGHTDLPEGLYLLSHRSTGLLKAGGFGEWAG